MVGRLAATVAGAFVVWLAVSLAINPDIVRPSATEARVPEDERAAITRTWYGEAARFAAAGLTGFFGVTLMVAPWRRRVSADASDEAR